MYCLLSIVRYYVITFPFDRFPKISETQYERASHSALSLLRYGCAFAHKGGNTSGSECVIMNHWLFTVTQKKTEGLEAEDIFKQRMQDGFWGLGERTSNRRSLRAGDRVVFYVGWPTMTFAGSAVLASESFELTDADNEEYGHGIPFYRSEHGVLLQEINIFNPPKLVKEYVPSLKFIENKENWNSYFQGGVRQLSDVDYFTITEGRTAPAVTEDAQDSVVSASQFALEAHLEDFIDKNWQHINFGLDLAKYDSEEQSGRQFPAGPWSIDFLCTDRTSGEFVVIELKRGRSSDSAVGQVLRYMGWVDENLASVGQRTRGIIIAREVDDALRYAVRGLANVSVLTYKVDFALSPFGR
jgi:hypothetical protein